MADSKGKGSGSAAAGAPTERPSGSPPLELYATSDIRFVMLEIGKLTSKVDRLITDVHGQGEKIDAVRHQISFVKGALWVIGAVIIFVMSAATLYFKFMPPSTPPIVIQQPVQPSTH